MPINFQWITFCLALILGFTPFGRARAAAAGPNAPTGLLVELLRWPDKAVITDARPEFGWIVNDTRKNAMQGAFQIQVAPARDALLAGTPVMWDSGQRRSAASHNVEYAGAPLAANTAYWWRVRTWDGASHEGPWSEPQRFNTGTFAPPGGAAGIFPGESRWVDLGGDTGWVLEDRQRADYQVVKPVSGGAVSGAPLRSFFDFGQAAFATLRFTAESPVAAAQLELFLGERREGADRVHKSPGKSNIGFARVVVPLARGRKEYLVELPRHAAKMPHSQKLPAHMPEVTPFRYAELIASAPGIRLSGVEQSALYYPFDDNASAFASSDERLDRVWRLSKYTLKATPFLSLYSDGNRERMPYEADAYNQQIGHYAVDREYAVARYTNQFLLHNPSWPTEWKMHAVFMAYEDYWHTGNLDHVARAYPDLKARLLLALARPDGLISTRTGLVTQAVLDSLHHIKNHPDIMLDNVDWPPGRAQPGQASRPFFSTTVEGERDGYVFADINTVMNAFHYRSLVMMTEVAAALGKRADARLFAARAKKVYAAFNRLLFDRARGVYVDGEGVTHASLHASMFPLAFGLVPAAAVPSVVAHIKSRGMACSVYGAQYLLDGLFDAGEAAYGLSLMTSDDKRSWLNMLRVGATMTTEAWDEIYKPNLTWNHAWGSAPANIVPRKLAGIEPLAPAFARLRIKPQCAVLDRLDLTMPTIRGAVRVAWRHEGGNAHLDVTIPANTRAELWLPHAAGARKVALGGGSHQFKVADGRAANTP